MISPRPWHRDPTNLTSLVDASGKTVYESSGDPGSVDQWDNMHHITECVLAIHESGIDPADLPKFVEAVRAIAEVNTEALKRMAGYERFPSNQFNDAIRLCVSAAACLPENRKRGAE